MRRELATFAVQLLRDFARAGLFFHIRGIKRLVAPKPNGWFVVGCRDGRDYDGEKAEIRVEVVAALAACVVQTNRCDPEVRQMVTRWVKLALLAGIGLYYTLVVLGNLTDFGTNYEFVRHVLQMDSTMPGNHEMWRSIGSPTLHLAFYWSIIAWETATMVLVWWGVIALVRAVRSPADVFNARKRIAVAALALSLVMWLVPFLVIGGEWFEMWQSQTWNGQEEAFRMFVVVGLVLLLLLRPDTEAQP